MKALNIIFIVLGLVIGLTAIINLTQSRGGTTLGFEVSHPYHGLIQLAAALVMLIAAYKYFKK